MSDHARVTMDRSLGRWLFIGIVTVMVGLLAGLATMIRHNQAAAHKALSDRFETRADLTAAFAASYTKSLAADERTQAQRLLSGPNVSQDEFDSVVESFDFPAAVLLDGHGRLLQVYPPKPELIGKDMTVAYAHLRAAAAGHLAVSQMVPSAARGVPVAAVAMPFESSVGPRVFSGAFSPSTTPLGSYLNAVVSISGGSTYLVDQSGHVLAAGVSAKGIGAAPAQLGVGIRGFDTSHGKFTAAVADVPGLPWRVVLVAPTAGLFAPVDHGVWADWAMWFAFAMTACIALLLFFRLARARAIAALTARTDLLTGLPNRRAMQESLHQAAALAVRHKLPLAALMIDIDRFKLINDTHGHDVGDLVIRATADALLEATREGDVAGRWGGEEFLVLIPHTQYDGVVAVAERVRAMIAAAAVPGCPTCEGTTVSIGMAMLRDGDSDALLREADTALYVAKNNGRNRVEGRSPDAASKPDLLVSQISVG